MTTPETSTTVTAETREIVVGPGAVRSGSGLARREPDRAGGGVEDAASPARLSSADARELTDRIRIGVEAVWELVKRAYVSRAWSVLGYDSWDDYCTREFGHSRLRLPREERSDVIASMREIGMSTRAIAAATGLGHGTVARNLPAGVPNGTPAPVTGVDGKTYEPKPTTPDQDLAGKRGPQPRPARRRPITDAFFDAAYTLSRDTERIARLAADARFAKNSGQIARIHLSDLVRARDAVQQVIDRLTPKDSDGNP
ncbi:hypothetical protein [Nocardia wallacei]|uniref:hypothetical protein n=1 Tax=Nocardia wallacei TaxID=480035 RepID=UPI002456DC07|nr:hypothetical protein [Nocardia wallacei]